MNYELWIMKKVQIAFIQFINILTSGPKKTELKHYGARAVTTPGGKDGGKN
jgi:hypothetical protein